MVKILVIGGAGFFGQKIVESLQKLPEADIIIGARRKIKGEKTLEINLENKPDFDKLLNFDFVVNCATLSNQTYNHLIFYCLANPINFIETTADFQTMERLLIIKSEIGKREYGGEGRGLFLFGVGIFPGISNLLYKKHLEDYAVCSEISLNIRYKVMSGAGKGMCKLMTEAISTPCMWFENSELKSTKAPFASLEKKCFENGDYYALQLALPEALFINANSNITVIRTFISFKPTVTTISAYYFFNIIPYMGFFKSAFLKILYAGFYLVRGIILKKSGTDIYISCVSEEKNISGVWFNDAFLAAGMCVAAIISDNEVLEKNKGMFSIEDAFDLESTVQRMVKLSVSDLQYRFFKADR